MATYEGWKNYETWSINLHLSNDEPLYRKWSKEAMRCLEGSSAPTARLAAQMEDEMTAFLESKSFAALPEYARDLLIMDMREVFWEEIAAHWIRAAKETRDR